MAIKNKKPVTLEAQLDMTPFTDSVFLLLIFFMVTTVFKNPTQLTMTLPDAWKAVKMEQVKITVEMNAGGEMAVNGKTVLMDNFDEYLVMEKNKTQSKTIVIRADQDAKHGDILKMMRLAKAVGIETISMAVEDLNLKEASARK